MDTNVWIIIGAVVAIAVITKLVRKKKTTATQVGEAAEALPVAEDIYLSSPNYETSVDIEKLENEPVTKLEELTSPDSDKPFAKLKMAESGKAEVTEPAPSENPSSETPAPKPKRVYKKRAPKTKPPTGNKA
jgi:hypothetical protein